MRLRISNAVEALKLEHEQRAKAKAAARAERSEQRRIREEKTAAHRQAKEEEKKRRNRAIQADRSLGQAIAMLEKAEANADNRRRQEVVSGFRDKIRRLEEILVAEREKLCSLEKSVAEVQGTRDDYRESVRSAWDEHIAAWSVLP